MSFPCKRFIAYLLLFSELLSSCSIHARRFRLRHVSKTQSVPNLALGVDLHSALPEPSSPISSSSQSQKEADSHLPFSNDSSSGESGVFPGSPTSSFNPSFRLSFSEPSISSIGHYKPSSRSFPINDRFLPKDFCQGYSNQSSSKGGWLSDEQVYNIIRIIYPALYSDQIVRLDLVGPSNSSIDTLKGSISSYIESNPIAPLTSLVQVGGNHWVTVLITQAGPSVYHAYYANSLNDPIQDISITSALTDSGISKIHKLKVSLQEDGNSCGIYAIVHANAIVQAIQSGRTNELISDGVCISPLMITKLRQIWSNLLEKHRSRYLTLAQNEHYVGRTIELSSALPLSDSDLLNAATSSVPDPQTPSTDQSSSSTSETEVEQFLERFTVKLSGTDRSDFEKIFIPILKDRLPTANASLQKSIISYFEKGGSFSKPILEHCPLVDWVKESLIQDLICGYYEDGNEITYPDFLRQLDKIIAFYQGPCLEGILYAIRDTAEKESFSLMDLSDLLEFLSSKAVYPNSSNVLWNHSNWSSWLPRRYLEDALKSNKVNLSIGDAMLLSSAVSKRQWRPCMISKLVSIINDIQDFNPVKSLLYFIDNQGISDKQLGECLYPYIESHGLDCLNKWLGQLASSMVSDQITSLFPDHASSINARLPSFFTYASPTETLESFSNFLKKFPQAGSSSSLDKRLSAKCAYAAEFVGDTERWNRSVLGVREDLSTGSTSKLPAEVAFYRKSNKFYSFLNDIQVDALVNEPSSKPFLDVIDLLSSYKVDARTAIASFKLLEDQIHSPNTWESSLHKLVIDATFKGIKTYTPIELIQQIKDASPDIDFLKDPNILYQRYQEIIDSYLGSSSILPGKPIFEWTKEEKSVEEWSQRFKNLSTTIPQREVLAVIKRAVALHHGYEPKDTQLLTLLLLLNPADRLGRLAQVNTGEGKSLIIAMLAAFHALQGKKVDVITTSTELTIPEVERQKGFFSMLNLTVGENSRKDFNSSKESIKEVYDKKDIVYSTPIDFQGDILRTNFSAMDTLKDRPCDIVIVDEVDSMLYDERKHCTRLASPLPGMDHLSLTLGVIWHEVDKLANQIRSYNGLNWYFTVPVIRQNNQDPATVCLASDAPLESCSQEIADVDSFIREKVTKELKQALRELTPEELKEFKEYKLLQKKESEIFNKYRNIRNEIQYYTNKLSQDYQEFQAKICRYIEYLTGKDLNAEAKEWKAKVSTCEKERSAIEKELVSAKAAKLNAPFFTQREAILDIPLHLRDFVLAELPHWIDNAIKARFHMQVNYHYTVDNGRIVPVDYDNTGVLQHNVVWSDGMHQFLQIKEGLKVTPESVCTNFLTNSSFFKRYSPSLFGLTGTLGNSSTRNFLQKMYDVDMVVIPPHASQEIAFNDDTPYRCKELLPIIEPTALGWYKSICDTTVSKIRNGRPVLIICKYIEQVDYIKKCLLKELGQGHQDKIFTYTGSSEDTHRVSDVSKESPVLSPGTLPPSIRLEKVKRSIGLGEILIATNIAGRGTDIIPSDEVESVGGMHVCISFLPESYRVEIQNAGRTARQDKKGSAQLVLHDPWKRNIFSIRSARNHREAIEANCAEQDVADAYIQEKFFDSFCVLEDSILPRASDAEKKEQYERIASEWKVIQSNVLNQDAIKRHFDKACAKETKKRTKLVIDHFTLNVTKAEKESPKFLSSIEEIKRRISQSCMEERKINEAKYETTVRNDFCDKLKLKKYDKDVINCFRKGEPFVSSTEKNSDLASLATKCRWGECERKGVQERWGFWYTKLEHAKKNICSEDVSKEFSEFRNEIASDSQSDQLIKNPYYYVEKGNQALNYIRDPQLAIELYDRAIALGATYYDKALGLDPTYSVTAHYNKARALLTREDNKDTPQIRAKKELEETARLIDYEYKTYLGNFNALLGFLNRKKIDRVDTSEHALHQLDILDK